MFVPFGNYDDEPWREPIRLLKIFTIFITIVVVLWGLGAIVLAVKDPVPRWGMMMDDD